MRTHLSLDSQDYSNTFAWILVIVGGFAVVTLIGSILIWSLHKI